MNLSTRAVLTAVAAAAVAVSASLGQAALIVVLGLLAIVYAVGWASLFRLPANGGSTLVVTLASAGALACVALTASEPWLRYLPIVLAFGVFLAFINEMLRPVPRTDLIGSLFGTVTGLIIGVCGAGWLATMKLETGAQIVVVSATALAAASIVGAVRMPRWIVVVATFLVATGAGALTAHFTAGVPVLTGVVQGAIAGLIVSALHALFTHMPYLENKRSAASLVVLPVLAVGILIYVAGRLIF